MKKPIHVILLLLLVLPVAAWADVTLPVVLYGVIGDSAPSSKVYELVTDNGDQKMLKLTNRVRVVKSDGQPGSLELLRGGIPVEVVGRKTLDAYGNERLVVRKIRIIAK